MTIYYIDPHTTTNGTGTWASPYSINSSTRASLVSGDEVRIKGVDLASLLTATVYTATYTSQYQLTLTAGGGLGADFAAYDIVYLPDVDAFFKIGSVAANVIATGSTQVMLPWYNTSTGQTTITVRKVNLAAYPASASSSGLFILPGAQNVNNITISDGWTSATTRVTDGTVKTLVHTSYSLSSLTNLYIDGSSAASTITTGRIYDLANTHFLHSNTTSAYLSATIYCSGVTASIGQIYNATYQSNVFGVGSGTFGAENVTVTIKHHSGGSPFPNVYGSNITLNFTNVVNYYSSYFFSYVTNQTAATNVTFNIGNCAFYSVTSSVIVYGGVVLHGVTYNLNGVLDFYSISSITTGMHGGFGDYSINYGAGFGLRLSRRTVTPTSVSYNYSNSNQSSITQINVVPSIAMPTGITAGSAYSVSLMYGPQGSSSKVPSVSHLSLPITVSGSGNRPIACNRLANLVVTHRDGSSPYENLGIYTTKGGGFVGLVANTYPVVTTDATTYRTAGPSLKSNLTTRTTTYWASGKSKSVKSIKIPVTAGVACTVSGYVRTDISTYTTGDCTMRVVFSEADLGSVAIASAYNAWAPFSISFTPTYTGEAVLLWEMYYAAAGNFWLDDIATS